MNSGVVKSPSPNHNGMTSGLPRPSAATSPILEVGMRATMSRIGAGWRESAISGGVMVFLFFRVGSGAAIGGIGIGRNEERYMVMRGPIGDAEIDRHHVEERRTGQRHAMDTKILRD